MIGHTIKCEICNLKMHFSCLRTEEDDLCMKEKVCTECRKAIKFAKEQREYLNKDDGWFDEDLTEEEKIAFYSADNSKVDKW
jgi:hypothetical protein